MKTVFNFTYNSCVLVGSEFGGTWEDPEGGFYQIRCSKSFKTRPNTPYGGETSIYSLLQQGVCICKRRSLNINNILCVFSILLSLDLTLKDFPITNNFYAMYKNKIIK